MAKRFIATALLVLAACAAPQTPAPSTPFALAGSSWQRNDDADANPHGAMLEFTDARASGYTGCNRWFADVTQSGAALRFGAIGMTRMACQAEVQAATERHFIDALNHTRSYHLDGEELVFTDDHNAVVARFTCSVEPCPHAN